MQERPFTGGRATDSVPENLMAPGDAINDLSAVIDQLQAPMGVIRIDGQSAGQRVVLGGMEADNEVVGFLGEDRFARQIPANGGMADGT